MTKRIVVILAACLIFMTAELSAKDKTIIDVLWPQLQTGIMLMDFAPVHRAYSEYFQGGTGFTVEFGLNAGRLLSDKFILAPYCGIEPVWGNKYPDAFVAALKDNYLHYDPMYHPPTMSTDEYFSLEEANEILGRMANGETTGFSFAFRYGIALQLPWRFIPAVRAFGMATMLGVYETGGSTDAYGHLYGGRLFGPSLKGYGFEAELWRGRKAMGEAIGSIWLATVRLGVEFTDFSKAELTEADDIDGTRAVLLAELMNPAFFTKYSKTISLWVAVSLACR